MLNQAVKQTNKQKPKIKEKGENICKIRGINSLFVNLNDPNS